jgi:hypothetical protein
MRTLSRHARHVSLLLTLSTVFTLSPGMAASTRPGPGPDCQAGWSVVSSPNGSGEHNRLSDVAVVSGNDIWAVGNTGAGLGPLSTLIEHWNGTTWSTVPSPNGVFEVNYLNAVSAVSSNDVWAVGYSHNGSVSDSQSRTLILHWNGTTWSTVPSPNTSKPDNHLYGVVAVSANDVWAVGTAIDPSVYQTLIMHWNGSNWSTVSSPNPGSSFNILYGVDAVSATNVWAVGTQQDSLEQTLVLRWNGTTWSVVPSPNVGPFGNNMLKVHAVSANDIWAVGYHLTVFGFTEPYQTSAFHFDGTSWSVVPTPNVNQLNNYLFDVVGLTPDDAWAVGFFDTGTALDTMIQHWNGTSWTIVPTPNPGAYANELTGVAAVSATDIWAVGDTTDGVIGVNTLVARYSAACPGTMHVSSITPSFKPRSGTVSAAVTIVDASEAPVPGATVNVNVTLPNNSVVGRVGTTNASGMATVSVNNAVSGTYTFTVTDVSKTGSTYAPASNVETSDVIVVP